MIDAKAYLSSIKELDEEIDRKRKRVEELWDLALKTTTTIRPDAGFASGGHDRIGDAMAQIECLNNRINEEIDAFVDLKRAAYKIIREVPSKKQRKLLFKRYFKYKTWSQIAREMRTGRNVYYIHKDALRAVSKIMKEEDTHGHVGRTEPCGNDCNKGD